MKVVVLCSDLAGLRRAIQNQNLTASYLVLQETEDSLRMRDHLRRSGFGPELSRPALYRERSSAFRSTYVEALGALNAEWASLEWWAMPFTTKNPISTTLCRDCFEYLLIVDLVKSLEQGLIVLTVNPRIAEEVERWGRQEQIRVINNVRSSRAWRQRVEERPPLMIALLILRAIWFRLRMRRFIPANGRRDAGVSIGCTLVHPHSISREGEFFDTYFGGLWEQLRVSGGAMTLLGRIQGLSQKLANRFVRTATIPHIPFEAALTVRETICCGIRALRQWQGSSRRWNQAALTLQGVSVTGLLQRAIRQSHAGGDVFQGQYVFECARRIAELMRPARWLYPYENRAWEKMLILGVRAGSPGTRLLGYNHASITGSHTNFMLRKGEADMMPFPNRIITLGAVTRAWLETEGGHPGPLLAEGCALRQAGNKPGLLRKRGGKAARRLLVALATSQLEYVNTLAFLQEAFTAGGFDQNSRIRIRPHPTFRLEQALHVLEGSITFPFEVSSESVATDLAWADAVLYASSTIGLEAVREGIPAVYMDLGDILNTDPMEGWSEFKWVASCPMDLGKVLAGIRSLEDEEFSIRQRQGAKYVEDYLAPVTQERIRVFQNA